MHYLDRIFSPCRQASGCGGCQDPGQAGNERCRSRVFWNQITRALLMMWRADNPRQPILPISVSRATGVNACPSWSPNVRRSSERQATPGRANWAVPVTVAVPSGASPRNHHAAVSTSHPDPDQWSSRPGKRRNSNKPPPLREGATLSMLCAIPLQPVPYMSPRRAVEPWAMP